jgi:hypothetical protein
MKTLTFSPVSCRGGRCPHKGPSLHDLGGGSERFVRESGRLVELGAPGTFPVGAGGAGGAGASPSGGGSAPSGGVSPGHSSGPSGSGRLGIAVL